MMLLVLSTDSSSQNSLDAEPVEQVAIPQETFPSGLSSYGYSDMSSMSGLADMLDISE
jgi:hypothetical protein